MRFLVLLIIVLLIAFMMWPRQPTPPIEETFIAPQLVPLEKAKAVEDQYMEALERSDAEIEKQSDGG